MPKATGRKSPKCRQSALDLSLQGFTAAPAVTFVTRSTLFAVHTQIFRRRAWCINMLPTFAALQWPPSAGALAWMQFFFAQRMIPLPKRMVVIALNELSPNGQ